MQISASEWVLGDRPSALRRARAAAFTSIELDAVPGADLARLRDDLAAAGLDVASLCWTWNPEHELGAPDPASRGVAQRYLLAALEQAEALGARRVVVVPACRSVPWEADPSREAGIDRAADAIRTVLADAPVGVGIALEGLRRDESFLMNSLDDAEGLRSRIEDPRAGLLADLYHMVAEDGDVVAALTRHAEAITLVHLAAPDRGPVLASTPGFAAIVGVVRALPNADSMTLEFLVHDDDAVLAESVRFAHSI